MNQCTDKQLDQAKLALVSALNRRLTTPKELRQVIKKINFEAGRRVMMALIVEGIIDPTETETFTLLADELELSELSKPLMQIIEDRATEPFARQLALMALMTGDPEDLDLGNLDPDSRLLRELASMSQNMLLVPILEEPEVASEIMVMLQNIPAEDRSQTFEHMDQNRCEMMIPAWLCFAPSLQSAHLTDLHEVMTLSIAEETSLTGVDVWDEIMGLDLPGDTWKLVQASVMRTRTARLNSRAPIFGQESPYTSRANAWISRCDGVGAYVILVCLYLETGQMHLFNVCLHTSGELRDGFVLAGRDPEELDSIIDVFRHESDYEFVRFPLELAHELVAKARELPQDSQGGDMEAVQRAAACLQWAAAMGSETDAEPALDSCELFKSDGTDVVDELMKILNHEDFSEWFLNRADLTGMGVDIVSPEEADDDWITTEAKRINTPDFRGELKLMFEHMVLFYQWGQDQEPAQHCRLIADMLSEGGDSSFLIVVHYLVHSLETIRSNEALGDDPVGLYFGDNVVRESLRQACFPNLLHPKGKHLAQLDLTELAWLILDREVEKMAAARRPRLDTLSHVALAMAKAHLSMMMVARNGMELPDDPVRYRRMVNAVRRQTKWTHDEVGEVWLTVAIHLEGFLEDVCGNCTVNCLGRMNGKMDEWFYSERHPGYGG